MTSVASRLPSRSKRCVSCLMRQARPRQAPACLPLAQHRRSPSSALRCVRSAIKPSLPRWPPSWANKFALFRCVIIFLCNNVAGAAHACPSGGLFACLLICSSWMIMLGPGSSFSVPLCASMEGKYGVETRDRGQHTGYCFVTARHRLFALRTTYFQLATTFAAKESCCWADNS